MNKFTSIVVIGIVVLGILGYIYLNVAEYSCDTVEEKKDGTIYQYETCCRYLGFSCFTKKTQINK